MLIVPRKGELPAQGLYNGWEADDKVNSGISNSLQKVIERTN